MGPVLTILLSHQGPAALQRVLLRWQPVAGNDSLFLAFGGTQEAYEQVTFAAKAFIADPRLRTRDHQRERQRYSAILTAASKWLKGRARFHYIHLVEFDHLPLVDDLNSRLVARIEAENADLLGHHLHRIDDTSHPHYLNHAADPDFHRWLASLSLRADKSTVLTMLGSGSFWRRDCFEAVAAAAEPCPIYFEIFLPTVAHHLGYRVRSWEEQSAFVANLPSARISAANARKHGAWTVHPVKTLPPAGEGVKTRFPERPLRA